ncbi:hypothetical protein G6F44_000355 [Rhizopus delemar]|nr:hypothetical protein G6F44_000355 [Rhizopus delemar]
MSTLDWLNDDSQDYNRIPKRLFSVINTPNANSTVNKPRETIMHEIEQTILDVVQSLSMGEPIQVPASTRKSRSKRKKTDSSSSQQQNKENDVASYQTRRLKLSSERSTRALARYLSVLRMIYEALAYKIVVTKRDMFYRDVELFHTQSVVNISAASKGLVFGSIVIKLKNNKMLDCMTRINKLDCHDVQGLLIPPASEIAEIQCKARCMIIIEKEGKGYPDLATRQFVKRFSKEYSHLPILALMDNDPHGLDIYATYKWGARAFAFDVFNLAVESIRLIGLTCQDRIDFNISSHHFIPLTKRDKSKCLSMVKTHDIDEIPGSSQMRDRGWADSDSQVSTHAHQTYVNEIFELLRTNYKCELQSLYTFGPYGLTIRDWVLIPVMVVMVLVGVLRHHITMLITGAPKTPQPKSIRESKALLRAMRLRTFGNMIPQHAFEVRKAYLADAFEKGDYLKNPQANKENTTPPNPMTDPEMMEGMMDGLKKQMMNMVPQMIIMGWINFFFQGFVVIKLPFPLTPRFKSMLQSGVDTRDMDVTWVSSLSWYFLNLFGLGSVFSLILGDNNAAGVDMTAMSAMPGMMPGMGQPGQPQDFKKLFMAEKENVMITPHAWDLDDIEERLLKKYGKKVATNKKETASTATTPNAKSIIAQKKLNKRR